MFIINLRPPLLYAKLVLLILTDSNSNEANIKSWFPLLYRVTLAGHKKNLSSQKFLIVQ